LNIEVECGLLMAIGDGRGDDGISVPMRCRRGRRCRCRRHVFSVENQGGELWRTKGTKKKYNFTF
jgi:hypothetical protein